MHTRIAVQMLFMLLGLAIGVAAAPAARAAPLLGDFNGDGVLDYLDEFLLTYFYGATPGDPLYDPAADFNADGVIDVTDLALFGGGFGTSGGTVDNAAPDVFVTLNDIPDDMNDLLVVPPDEFDITLAFDSLGGSVIHPASLSVTSDRDFGALTAGTELAPFFSIGQTSASWRVPAGSDLERTSHYLTVSVSDLAGNTVNDVYGFAVRDYPISGAPLGDLQWVFLDFTQDRSLGPDVDFVEDLRTFHLASAAAPQYETQMRDWIVMEIVARANLLLGRNPDGSAAPDSPNLQFVETAPVGTHSRLCVGGSSQLGSSYLGATQLDVNNVNDAQDECAFGSYFGVFPQAIDNLWAGDPDYQAALHPLDPLQAGTPVGEHALDPIVLDSGYDPATGSAQEAARWGEITNAVDAFSQVIASAIAHETGHLVGLVAHGAAPGGLFGGSTGGDFDHNVTPGGGTPATTHLMNQGAAFSFAEMTGRAGEPLPDFRTLNWAYLRDEVVLAPLVTALYPPPTITSVSPPVVDLSAGPVTLTINGSNFVATPRIELVESNDPTPNEVLGEAFVDPNTITGIANGLLVQPALYDVEVINPDGQKAVLAGGLLVQ